MAECEEQPTRRGILDFLKTNGASEARVIAESKGLTTMAVRRHLLNLRADGLIQGRIERRPKGRPTALYSLTESGDAEFPKDYAALACDLLSSLVSLNGEAKIKQVFRKRRANLKARYLPRMKGKNLEQRVCETAAILTESGYMADVRPAGSGVFRLTERNCAIPQVAKSFPAVCDEELCFIRDLVGAKVGRVNHMLAGACQCSYLIRPRRPS